MALHRRCTSVHFSIQPTYTPARDGWPGVPAQGMRAVDRSVWYQISTAIQARRFIHLGDADSKQWAASSLWAYLVRSLSGWLNYYVRYFLSASGNLPHMVLFVNNNKEQNRP